MSRIETREKIIQACAPLFEQKGYKSVSIPDIEKVSGQTKAILYGYFDNKQAITLAVLDYNLEYKRTTINNYVTSCVSCAEKLMAHVVVYYPKNNSSINVEYSILNAVTEAGDIYKEMRQRVAQALLLWKQDIAAIIRAGTEANEFRSNIPPDETAWQLISLIEGAIIISKTMQNTKLGAQLLDKAKNLITGLASGAS